MSWQAVSESCAIASGSTLSLFRNPEDKAALLRRCIKPVPYPRYIGYHILSAEACYPSGIAAQAEFQEI